MKKTNKSDMEIIIKEARRLKVENEALREMLGQNKGEIEHLSEWLLEFVRLEDKDAALDDVFIENTLQEAHTNLNSQLSTDEYKLAHLEGKLKARNESIEYLSHFLLEIGELVDVYPIGDFNEEFVESAVEEVESVLRQMNTTLHIKIE